MTSGLTAPHVPPALVQVREFLSSDPTQGTTPTGGWDQCWKAQVTPWDSQAKDVQPSLRELVEDKWHDVDGVEWSDLVEGGKGKALVAGCGRGYDAIYFASKGFDAVGMDLSPTAVERAKEHHASLSGAPQNVTFQAADFFSFDLATPFSLAYDFTFFCALPPSMRQRWGDRYAEVVRQDGVLITLEYPLDGDRQGGPPYSVSEQAYDEVLSPNFAKIYEAVPTKQTQGHEGREKIAVWKRK
ncbi:hypothetical protein JCM10212_000959 [Sporobolomyces blumeae]